MKILRKIFRVSLMAVTGFFIARGAGHVPRQLLLISGCSEASQVDARVVAVIPAPRPIVAEVVPDFKVAEFVTVKSLPSFSNLLPASLSGRAPPFSQHSLLS